MTKDLKLVGNYHYVGTLGYSHGFQYADRTQNEIALVFFPTCTYSCGTTSGPDRSANFVPAPKTSYFKVRETPAMKRYGIANIAKSPIDYSRPKDRPTSASRNNHALVGYERDARLERALTNVSRRGHDRYGLCQRLGANGRLARASWSSRGWLLPKLCIPAQHLVHSL
jgi:hypothetical protein